MKKIGLILGLVNSVAIAAVLGLFLYTKVLYKHPPITEASVRVKIEQAEAKSKPEDPSKRVLYPLDPITVNLDGFTGADGKPKTHFASLTLALEIRKEKDRAKVDSVKAVILDQVIQNLAKKKFEDLNQVQGRYVFKSQIIDDSNAYLKAPLVTDVYFTEFMLQ